MIFILLLASIIISIDQATKWLAVTQWKTPLVFTDWFRFIYHENTGIAFSIPITGIFLIILTLLLIIGGIWACYHYLPWRKLPYQLSIALILGGAIGNAIDRIRLQYVIDFVSIGWFPVFNVADSAITVGGILLFCLLTFQKEETETTPTTHN